MNKHQIEKSSSEMLVNRYKWLVKNLEELNKALSRHNDGSVKFETRSRYNKANKSKALIDKEMEIIEAEMQKRREIEKAKNEMEKTPDVE